MTAKFHRIEIMITENFFDKTINNLNYSKNCNTDLDFSRKTRKHKNEPPFAFIVAHDFACCPFFLLFIFFVFFVLFIKYSPNCKTDKHMQTVTAFEGRPHLHFTVRLTKLLYKLKYDYKRWQMVQDTIPQTTKESEWREKTITRQQLSNLMQTY